TWNIGQSGPDIVVSSNGMYQVSVQNIHGCTASDKMWLDVVEVPIDAGTDQQVCKNDTLYLYAGGVDSVRWYDAGTFNPGGTNSPAFVGDTFVYLATQSFTWLAEGYVTSKGLTCTWLDTVHADVYPQNFVQDINGTVNPDSVNVYTYSVDNTGQSSFQWTVQNGTLLNGQGTSSIEVVWTHPGNGEVHVVATSPDGCTSETNKLVMVVPTSLTNPRLPQFKAYPNPAHHQLTLEFEKEMKGANVRLMDARGRICLETQVNGDQLVLDIEALSRGIYLIQVEGYGQRLQVLE
ncbi:MAG: T9SS type A sorting domain-containing protein, partial [Bacteroidota bacterium]|nr:T9SS type A sorting domain-containing protein [Bacteroidota bacterium]MDX5429509.1 T9SS type A sorting domain-containing protein [Bacteroidota bacterium]MDX5468294.1 T9SS type A sorting domain-containing protein [Bacteroidota bacterium]